MFAMFGVIAILFISSLLENFFGIPTIQFVRERLERLFTGKGYLRFFALTALFALCWYAIGIAAMGPFLGIYQAAAQVGTLCLLILLGGILMSFLSFVGDVARVGQHRSTSVLTGTIFVTAVWGCFILLTFYNARVSGPLLSAHVGH